MWETEPIVGPGILLYISAANDTLESLSTPSSYLFLYWPKECETRVLMRKLRHESGAELELYG